MAGPPGAGKSTLARKVAAAHPDAVVVDKDVVTGAVVDAALRAAGAADLDREGDYYRRHLSSACYASTEAVATGLVADGVVPVLVAPYERTIDEPCWPTDLARRLVVDRLVAVWVVAGASVLRARLHARGEPRDVAKLARDDGIPARWGADVVPRWPHLLVRTTKLAVDDLDVVASRILALLDAPAPPDGRRVVEEGTPLTPRWGRGGENRPS